MFKEYIFREDLHILLECPYNVVNSCFRNEFLIIIMTKKKVSSYFLMVGWFGV